MTLKKKTVGRGKTKVSKTEKGVCLSVSDIKEKIKEMIRSKGLSKIQEEKIYFIYTRISDISYDESIYDQVEMLKITAEKNKIKNIIIVSERKSWHKTWRDLFDEIINILEEDHKKSKDNPDNKMYWGIIFRKVDRLSRNYEDFTKLDRLLDWWYEFISTTEKIEATYTGRLLFRILGSFAIYESDKNSARQGVKRIGMFLKKELWKLWVLWWSKKRIQFWYRITQKGDLKVNQEEASVVKFIFDEFLNIYRKVKFLKKEVYEEIEKNMSLKMKQCCSIYLSEKKSERNVIQLIAKVLENSRMIDYCGMVRFNVDIKDSLVAETSSRAYKENKDDALIIDWCYKIWWQIKFSLFEKSLEIIDFSKVAKIKKTKIARTKKTDDDDKQYLFEDLVYFEKNTKQTKWKWYFRPKKKTCNYRWCVWNEDIAVSEKKLEEFALSTSIIRNLNVLIDDERWLKKIITERNYKSDHLKLLSLQARKMAYDRKIKKLENELLELNSWMSDEDLSLIPDLIEKNTKELVDYKELLQEVEDDILDIEKKQIQSIDIIKELADRRYTLSTKGISEDEKQDRYFLYKLIFEKIIITKLEHWSKRVEFKIYPEIKEKIESKWIKDAYSFIIEWNSRDDKWE